MKLIIITFLILVVSGCNAEDRKIKYDPDGGSDASPFAMECEEVRTTDVYVNRCENDEVVCYTLRLDGGISCKFKDKK